MHASAGYAYCIFNARAIRAALQASPWRPRWTIGSSPNFSVVIPNLHLRYSGVTATNRMVAPRLSGRIAAAWFGTDLPAGVTRLSFGDLLRLRGGAQRRKPRIWHARRNNEMQLT
jgi:hypothetical protein